MATGATPTVDRAAASRGVHTAICAALFLGTLLLFSRAIGNAFVNYDDPDYVTANAQVQRGLSGAGVRWAFSTSEISYWHPLTWLSHLADWSCFGADPHGHHAVSVVWHALNAVLLFIVWRRFTGAVGLSAFVAACFAWHPLRVESVAWIAERKDVLSGFFWLAALAAYGAFARRRDDPSRAKNPWSAYAIALLLFAGGLMSKPMVVTLPLVLLVLDFWPLQRWSRNTALRLLLEKLPFFAMSAAVSWITVVAQKNVGTLSDVLPLGARLANAAVAVVRYLGKIFVPVDLAVLYPHPGTWPTARVIFAVGFVVAVTAVAWWQRRRRPWILAGWAWFLAALLPVSGVVQVGIQSMADRYTYLPAIGIVMAVGWTIGDGLRSASLVTRRTAGVLAAAGLVALAAATWRQLAVWRDSFTLFDRAIAVTEKNYLAFNNRGLFRYEHGEVSEAMADYRRSLAINPEYPDANNNLAHALLEQGRPAEAVPYLRAALRRQPAQLEIHNNLGNALSDLGALDEAIEHYRFVLARAPDHANALNGLGVALAMQGKLADAVTCFETVLRTSPDNASAHSNLGNAFALMGRASEAVTHYRGALALSPGDARTSFNLGNALMAQGALDEAAASYREALRFAPVNPDAHASLGLVLARLGRRDEAVRELENALQQRPDHPQARAWLDALLAAPASSPSSGK